MSQPTVRRLLVIIGALALAVCVPSPRGGQARAMTPWLSIPMVAEPRLTDLMPAPATDITLPAHYAPDPVRRVYRVTAYCDRGTTAAGVPSDMGQCAAPADIPFGAIVYIPELDRRFVVTDRTAKRFRHNTVDLFMPRRDECLDFGRQYLECHVYLPCQRVRYGSPVLHEAIAAFAH